MTLNQDLLMGTWLQLMGIPPYCKVCDSGVEESPQHCLSSVPWCNVLGKLTREFVKTGKRPRISPSPGHSSYSGSLSPNERTTLSGSLAYYAGGFTYPRQPLDILRSFLLYFH